MVLYSWSEQVQVCMLTSRLTIGTSPTYMKSFIEAYVQSTLPLSVWKQHTLKPPRYCMLQSQALSCSVQFESSSEPSRNTWRLSFTKNSRMFGEFPPQKPVQEHRNFWTNIRTLALFPIPGENKADFSSSDIPHSKNLFSSSSRVGTV